MNIFKTLFNLGNIRNALEKTYGGLSVAITVMNASIEEMQKTTTPSKYLKDLQASVKLMITVEGVIAKILSAIGGTIPVITTDVRSDIQKQIDILNGLKI